MGHEERLRTVVERGGGGRRRRRRSTSRLQQKINPVREERKVLPLLKNPVDPFPALEFLCLFPGKSLLAYFMR